MSTAKTEAQKPLTPAQAPTQSTHQQQQPQQQQRQKNNVPRRNLSYHEKLMIIQKKDAEPSWTQENLALWSREQFKLNAKPTQATISNILRSRDKLQCMNVPPDFRSARPVKNPELDLAMIRWVLGMLSNNAPLTRDAIQQRAVALAAEMKITTGITFSKGWVSSFMKRHQLHFRKKHGDSVDADLEVIRQPLVPAAIPSGPAATPAKQTNKRKRATSHSNAAVAGAWGGENSSVAQLHLQQQQLLQQQQQLHQQQQQGSGFVPALAEETLAGDDLFVLQWLTSPGNYLRWKKSPGATAKGPLFDEINAMLRVQNMRELTGIEIRVKISTLVKSFKAANSWLAETGLHEALDMERATGGNDVKGHVVQLCKHYDLLAPALSGHVNDGNDDDDDDGFADDEAKTKLDQEAAKQPSEAADNQTSKGKATPPPPPQPKKRRSSKQPEKTTDKEKQQQLFDLECQKLQCDIEAKQVQLMVEKTLARKKLLDAGISMAEVDKIFPL